jgi:hypothetical protein
MKEIEKQKTKQLIANLLKNNFSFSDHIQEDDIFISTTDNKISTINIYIYPTDSVSSFTTKLSLEELSCLRSLFPDKSLSVFGQIVYEGSKWQPSLVISLRSS